MNRLPKYAVDLLIAAKFAASPAISATPEQLNESLQKLASAVLGFELAMPVIEGVVQEGPAQTQREELSRLLTDYRAGNRGMPTYAELAAIAGADHDGHAQINATPASIFDVLTGTAGKDSGPVHVRAAQDASDEEAEDIAYMTGHAAGRLQARKDAMEQAARICDQQAAEWDSDAVVSNKNYAARCATLIRGMAQRGSQ